MKGAGLLYLFGALVVAGCTAPYNTSKVSLLEAGFRFSSYGPAYNPGPDYWPYVGEKMAAKFAGAKPASIWIVGVVNGDGTYLNFGCEPKDPLIRCGYADLNEDVLTAFDQQGFDVWLQVEPGNASVDELIEIVLGHYADHPSVVGFGVDVEWYQSTDGPEGTPIADEVAKKWVKEIQEYNPDYRLFLKHWDSAWMPPKTREGILFVNDSQQFDSLDQMMGDFTDWGKAFAPSPVAFQYGYPADRVWWSHLQDPPKEIGQALLDAIPNTQGLFWVDFTIIDVFPPQ